MRSRTGANAIKTADRQRQALVLRRSGKTLQEIADQLNFAGPSGARRAIETALEKALTHDASALRMLEGERLDQLQVALWPKATKGDIGAVTAVLKIMDRRAKLYGLDAPAQHQVQWGSREMEIVQRIAVEQGLDPAEVLAEAEQLLKEASDA